MDELWPSLRVHVNGGAWVCEDEGPESEGHATWWWRLKVCGTAGVHAQCPSEYMNGTCLMLTSHINTRANTVKLTLQPVTDSPNLYMLSCAHRQVDTCVLRVTWSYLFM